MPRRPVVAVALAATSIVLLTGCGSSESRAESALARLRNRPPVGYVRVLNLTSDDVNLSQRKRPLVAQTSSGLASNFAPIAAGDQKMTIAAREILAKVSSNEGVTIIALPGNANEVVPGEHRRPNGDKNVRIVFLNGDGSLKVKTFPSISGPTPVSAGSAVGELSLEPGEYKVGAEAIKIEPNYSYTFMLVPIQGKARVVLMLNTPNQKPAGSGMSAA